MSAAITANAAALVPAHAASGRSRPIGSTARRRTASRSELTCGSASTSCCPGSTRAERRQRHLALGDGGRRTTERAARLSRHRVQHAGRRRGAAFDTLEPFVERALELAAAGHFAAPGQREPAAEAAAASPGRACRSASTHGWVVPGKDPLGRDALLVHGQAARAGRRGDGSLGARARSRVDDAATSGPDGRGLLKGQRADDRRSRARARAPDQPIGKIWSSPSAGRGITWTPTSSPTRRAAAAPASVAAFTDGDVPADDRGDQPGVDLLPADEDDVGRLDHRVGRLDHADQAAGLHHAERFAGKFLRHGYGHSTTRSARAPRRCNRSSTSSPSTSQTASTRFDTTQE